MHNNCQFSIGFSKKVKEMCKNDFSELPTRIFQSSVPPNALLENKLNLKGFNFINYVKAHPHFFICFFIFIFAINHCISYRTMYIITICVVAGEQMNVNWIISYFTLCTGYFYFRELCTHGRLLWPRISVFVQQKFFRRISFPFAHIDISAPRRRLVRGNQKEGLKQLFFIFRFRLPALYRSLCIAVAGIQTTWRRRNDKSSYSKFLWAPCETPAKIDRVAESEKSPRQPRDVGLAVRGEIFVRVSNPDKVFFFFL